MIPRICDKTGYRVGVAVLVAAVLTACGGGDGGGGGNEPPEPVLTSLVVTPSSANIYNTAPGNVVTLVVVAKDQNGVVMTGLAAPTFTSGNTGVATVSASGSVAAVAAGNTQVSVSVQHGGVTVTKSATVNVLIPLLTAAVGSSPTPQPSFVPAQIHIAAGGDVIWSLTGPEHSVTFTSGNAPADIPSLINASASRSFPVAGTFNYICDFHPTMSGKVFVH